MGGKLTEKTVSLKGFGDSEKVTKEAGEFHFELADSNEVDATIAKSVARNKPILDYLKDK